VEGGSYDWPEWDDHDLGKLPDYKDNGRMTQDWRQSKTALADSKLERQYC
jgi:hypothetical protein